MYPEIQRLRREREQMKNSTKNGTWNEWMVRKRWKDCVSKGKVHINGEWVEKDDDDDHHWWWRRKPGKNRTCTHWMKKDGGKSRNKSVLLVTFYISTSCLYFVCCCSNRRGRERDGHRERLQVMSTIREILNGIWWHDTLTMDAAASVPRVHQY